MTASDFAQDLVAPFGPRVPIDTLVVELNRLYHSFEATDYDNTHPEVHEQLPPFWSQMIQTVMSDSKNKAWNVLDFGCGTGFEAGQILEKLGPSRIRSLTCYDPSPEMLERCRVKIGSRMASVRFCTKLDEVMNVSEPYDLVATNSLLHHLPSAGGIVRQLEPAISKDAWWLMGHEPSGRFYRNDECFRAFNRYQRGVRWRKLASPRACCRSLQRLLRLGDYPAESTANAAFKEGLFAKLPSASAIARLVDFNVPHSAQEATGGRGFDFEDMGSDLTSVWQLRWVRSYAFMGSFAENRLPAKWRSISERLGAKHPLDGANFCSVWSHK